MYIPLELNVPLVVGGLIAHLVQRSAKGDEKLAHARGTRGTLIASGFIAGGALMGVVAAVLKIANFWTGVRVGSGLLGHGTGAGAEILALVMYVALATYMYFDARRGQV